MDQRLRAYGAALKSASIRRTKRAVASERAMGLKVKGYSNREIARKLGISTSTVWKYIHSAVAKCAERAEQDADTLRQVQMDRLEKATKALMPIVATGDPKAIKALVSVMNRQAKLCALDKQEKAASEAIAALLGDVRSVLGGEESEEYGGDDEDDDDE